jgi:hypothetical protein
MPRLVTEKGILMQYARANKMKINKDWELELRRSTREREVNATTSY